jgi:dUTP pyrophosphatase
MESSRDSGKWTVKLGDMKVLIDVDRLTPEEMDVVKKFVTFSKSKPCLDSEIHKQKIGTNSFHELKVKKLSEHATIPTKAHSTDAGWDLYAAYDRIIGSFTSEADIEPKVQKLTLVEKLIVKTDIAIDIPSGYYGKIEDRSSMALKRIKTAGGVIDAGYHGNIGVIMLNLGDEPFMIKKGDRIAQLIIHQIPTTSLVEVDDFKESERGEGGFGSTGV